MNRINKKVKVITVSIPEDTISELDRLAAVYRVSRSSAAAALICAAANMLKSADYEAAAAIMRGGAD